MVSERVVPTDQKNTEIRLEAMEKKMKDLKSDLQRLPKLEISVEHLTQSMAKMMKRVEETQKAFASLVNPKVLLSRDIGGGSGSLPNGQKIEIKPRGWLLGPRGLSLIMETAQEVEDRKWVIKNSEEPMAQMNYKTFSNPIILDPFPLKTATVERVEDSRNQAPSKRMSDADWKLRRKGGLSSHGGGNYSNGQRGEKGLQPLVKEVTKVEGDEMWGDDNGDEAVGLCVVMELFLNFVSSTAPTTMKLKGGTVQPEVLMFDEGAILTFTPTHLVQHGEVLWVGATGYGVLMDAILMVGDPLSKSANFFSARELVFTSLVTGLFAREIVIWYDILQLRIANVEASGASKLLDSADME